MDNGRENSIGMDSISSVDFSSVVSSSGMEGGGSGVNDMRLSVEDHPVLRRAACNHGVCASVAFRHTFPRCCIAHPNDDRGYRRNDVVNGFPVIVSYSTLSSRVKCIHTFESHAGRNPVSLSYWQIQYRQTCNIGRPNLKQNNAMGEDHFSRAKQQR